MDIIKITISKKRLFAGLPAYNVEGQWWEGFETSNGSISIFAQDEKTWLEYAGDFNLLVEGGQMFQPTDLPLDEMGFNYMIGGMKQRLFQEPGLIYGAINKPRFKRNQTAVTCYKEHQQILVPNLKFSGFVSSSTITPPVMRNPEPLNFWIETTGMVDIP